MSAAACSSARAFSGAASSSTAPSSAGPVRALPASGRWRSVGGVVGRRHADRAVLVRGRSPRDPIIAPAIMTSPKEATDINSYLLDNRVIFIGSRITDDVTCRTVAALLAMEALDPAAEITMYINSSGGSPYSVVAILDVMEAVAPPIRTVAFGQVATAPAALLAAGTKGRRFAMPSTRLMLYQPIGGAEGSADEVNITTTELHRTMRLLNAFLAKFTGRTEEELEEESDRPNCMSPQQAVEFGLIDGVMESMKIDKRW